MPSILVIEDDANLNKGIVFALEKENYEMFSAETLAQAWEVLGGQPVQMIILDLNLPDGDGMDFCRTLREKSQIPVIMLTARDLETDEVQGLECGADDYLTKPFSLAVLKARVANIIKRRAGGENNGSGQVPIQAPIQGIRCGSLFWNQEKGRFYLDDKELELTVTERKLLSYFMENRNQTLTKNQILDAVWDVSGNFVDENTLAVNVGRLRKKLEGKEKVSCIQTVFGVGYRFGEAHGQ